MSTALIVVALFVAINLLAVVVLWGFTRIRPRTTDRPYRVPSGSPAGYAIAAVWAPVVAILVLGSALALVNR